jgi:uncharacterized protein YacL
MLILLVRIVFVTLATLIGLTSGQHFWAVTPNSSESLPPWFGGAMGFGVAVTLIAAENAFRRHFTRSLVAFLIGLGVGLLLSFLLLSVLKLVIQDENIYNNLDLPLALVTTYLVLVLVLRNTDHFRVIIPFVEFRAERAGAGAAVLDAQVLGDGRLNALVRAGMLPRRLLVHRKTLAACEALALSADQPAAVRGRRALDGLTELRGLPNAVVEIDESEIPGASTLADILVHLARLEGGRLVAGDRELLALAQAEGIAVVDLNALAAALAPVVRQGESISVLIEKAGEGKGQGLGHLDDGSLVVVSEAETLVGRRVRCTVMRLHPTANGRMVFCDRPEPL